MSYVFAPSTLKLVRGTTWSDVLQIQDDAGNNVNLTGYSYLLMRVRSSPASATTLLELSTDNGRLTVTTAASGIVTLLVSAEDTLDFPINGHRKAKYVYDCLIGRGGSPEVIEPAFGGKVTVLPQITRKLTEP